ncbi:MAG TPA: adenylate/guanylate cyclase domain-containing protein, partial [Pyrinomonadaceae bacterium]|nr:adenylate/guanylate cyclase domain-containing protein [Pyrinomonadaceae bacterium]
MAEVSFGEWLRRQRKAAGLTQDQLALQISCSTSALKKIEAEERRPSAQIVERLAEIFNIPQNERTAFLCFARGDWRAVPAGVESTPWLFPHIQEREDRSKLTIRLVTFLFTDIEDSAKLWESAPKQMKVALGRHHAILQEAIESNRGTVFQIVGDAFCAAFPTAASAVFAAVTAQHGLYREYWNLPFPIRVRMGIHTGEAEPTINGSLKGGYESNQTLNRVARILAAGHGGQILLSFATKELAKDSLPENTELRDMGEHYLKNLIHPEHLFQLTIAGLPSEFSSLNTLAVRRHNLPLQLTSFIGREKEMEEIKQSILIHKLVTLTGAGGTGKSRLSLQVAADLLDEFSHGVWLVELAPITDPPLVIQAVCAALDVTPQGHTSALKTLTDYLRPKKILLVIDNCEHLIDACAQLAEALLHACPDLRIIASSREALGIEGESAYHVPSLSLADSKSGLHVIKQSEAVQLFVARASAILPGYALTEVNASTIAKICRRLDGIALAIELAASRVKLLKVEQIAARLEDAFRLLTGGSRTALPRQQTLRGTIDWSYNLLTDEERIVLRRLSVFVGGWTLDAAEAVCDNPDILDLLTHLVDKSLVAVDR